MFTANANNYLLTENVLDLGGQIVASARFDDTNPAEIEGFYFYHYDMRGSTTAIVSAAGTLKTGYEYDEFGNIEQTGSQTFLNDVTFTGSITDKSTGLQYMNSRFYNPGTGRFLSQDTYSGNPYEPWTQHLYAYTANNPVNFIDPTGHSVASIQNELDELKRQRKIRITLRDNYAKNRWNYAEGSEMFNLLTGGWQRNRQIVKDLNSQIRQKEKALDDAMASLRQQMADNKYTSEDDAALGFLLQYQDLSQKELREYGGLIFKNLDGTYRLSDTYIGDRSSVTAMGSDALWYATNPGMGYIGNIHTHPEAYSTVRSRYPDETYCCSFSGAADSAVYVNILGLEIGFADNVLPGIRYVGAPNGVMYKSVNGGVNTMVYNYLSIAQSAANVPQVVYPNH